MSFRRQSNIRQAAVAALSTWLQHTSLRELFEGEMLADALRTGTPNTRAELLAWMAVQMKEGELTGPPDCAPHPAGCTTAFPRDTSTDDCLCAVLTELTQRKLTLCGGMSETVTS